VTASPEAAGFAARFDVSRETLDRLATLHDLVLRWNSRINLIGRASESEVWSRHIADSAQLWPLRPHGLRHWLDLGSGAGFPGLVVAAFGAALPSPPRVTLVESDGRKAVFLAEAARAMGVAVDLRHARIETLPPQAADVVSARALAPLDRLLGHLEKHRAPAGIGLFPKGATVHKEIEDAARAWRFEHRIHRSVTDPRAAVVEVGALSRA
jgi:16S rRNA (guanine527-N7)-methyltransferase